MANPNIPNAANNKPKNTSTKDKRDLINEYINKNSQSNNHIFLDSVFNADDISEIKGDLESIKFEVVPDFILNPKGNQSDKYPSVELNNSLLSDIKKKIAPEYIVLKNKREILKKLICSNYIIESNEEQKLLSEINTISESKIITFIGSDKLIKKFVLDVLGNGIKRKDIFNSIIPFSNIYKKLDKLPKADKDLLIDIFTEIQNGKLTDVGLKTLIETELLSIKQKKDIIVNLIPTISLSEILHIGLLDKSQTELLKSKIIDRYINDLGNIDVENKDIIDLIKDEDIIIEIDDFLKNEDNLLKISDGIGFLKTEKEFNKYKEEVIAFQNKEGVQTFDKLKNELKKSNIEGFEKFDIGSVIKLNFEKEDKKEEKYLVISNFDDNDNSLELTYIGNKQKDKVYINKKNNLKSTHRYHEFIELISSKKLGVTSSEIFTGDEFDEKIKDRNTFEVETENLDLLNINSVQQEDLDKLSNFKNDTEKQDKVKKDIIANYENINIEIDKELSELNSNKDSLIEQHKDKKISDIEKKSKLDTINLKISQLELRKETFDNYIEDINNNGYVFDELVSQNNFNELLSRINDIDNDGMTIGLGKGVLFETKSGIYEIIGLDIENGSIEILGINGKEGPVDYETFFQAFKEQKVKRIKKTNSFEEIIDNNTDNWTEFGKKIDFDIKNGELIQNDVEFNGEKNNKVIDFFVTDKGEIFKIVSIGSNDVEVIFGKYSEGKKDKDTKSQKNTITLEESTTQLSFSDLNKIINDNKFKPDWKIGKDYSINNTDEYNNPNIKGGFGTRFMNRLSIMEVFMSGKMLIDGVEDYFKRGNEVKSAELAMKLSSIIPGEFSEDFKAQTEQKQEEAMDKELTVLGKISSRDAFLRVRKWMLNKDTPQYKLEAGLLLASKYGMLYPKELAKYEGTFFWYEVLGGRIGDTKYEEAKEKARKSGLPFDEKELLIDLLGGQCLGFSKPNRRSKYYKLFKGKIAGGFGEENDTGYKDAQDKRSIDDINDGGMAEVTSGVVPNALGWAKKAVEKGGSLKQMNMIYFSLMHSGGLYNAPGKVLEELKDHWTRDGNSMIMATFASTLSGQKLFNKTVRDISIDIHNVDGEKYPGLKEDALKLYNDSENNNGNYKQRTEASANFWNKYGDVLSRTLYMADYKGKADDQYLKTDKIISMGGSDKYKGYMSYIKDFTNLPTAFAKGYMEDDVGVSGVTGIDNFEIVSKLYKTDTGGAFKSDNQKMIDFTWSTIWPDIISTKERIEADPDNKQKYKDYLNKKLREVAAGLISNIGIKNIHHIDNVDPSGLDLLSIDLRLSDLKEFRVKDIVDTNVGNEIFEKAVDNVVGGNTVSYSKLGDFSLLDLVDNTKKNTKETIDINKEDDDNYDNYGKH